MRNTFLVVAILSWCGVLGLAQAPESLPAFEVATIKPSGPASAPMSIRRLPGGRFVTSNTSLTMLINWAYQLDEGRLIGAARELDSTRFDVVAKAPEPDPIPGRMQLMMSRITKPESSPRTHSSPTLAARRFAHPARPSLRARTHSG